ncbi:4-hydroxyphenylpyruvate dioxygenase [Phormidium sp. CLA17]|uniref:4-hydroxyphenylpyruvate dioxygenase n=1 Tax=Leptolyngbya sp. Cla-17 TaxID=2803751 RepID=UPI001492FBD2|nr:4-hydroxyphenylpyruvate dioxygenase [Leptolyngbya sp. Cla-17]MBM0741391.1 4-hydroxyphenylpyruvate dioxygenase [Leptolyngbya sp. Cla-17]
MNVDHVCFCVEDAKALSAWFINHLKFQAIASGIWQDTAIEVLNSGSIYFLLCSPLTHDSAAARFLQQHPPGVSNVAFRVPAIESAIAQATNQGVELLQPIHQEQQAAGILKWAEIQAWGSLTHTFIERCGITSLLPQLTSSASLHSVQVDPAQSFTVKNETEANSSSDTSPIQFLSIDHIVLNVAKGELDAAVSWYERVLGLQPNQKFAIQTEYSGLCSQVMRHPLGNVQIPINEPSSTNSQIQEFLTVNRGAGIQHIALETVDLIDAIAQLRQAGLPLISIPSTYYTQLQAQPECPFSKTALNSLASQQILVDWHSKAEGQTALLQIFTQPIFTQPTFFFELIERQSSLIPGQLQRAQGFGEGNFQALFEAIEREQIKRGNLPLLVQETADQPQK